MEDDPRVGIVSREVARLVEMYLHGMKEIYFSIGFVDHHGIWIAPAVAEIVARDLESNYSVGVSHYGLIPRIE
jgi:hypothetical protein